MFCYIICRRSYYLAEMAQSVATGRTVPDSNPGWGNIFFPPKNRPNRIWVHPACYSVRTVIPSQG